MQINNSLNSLTQGKTNQSNTNKNDSIQGKKGLQMKELTKVPDLKDYEVVLTTICHSETELMKLASNYKAPTYILQYPKPEDTPRDGYNRPMITVTVYELKNTNIAKAKTNPTGGVLEENNKLNNTANQLANNNKALLAINNQSKLAQANQSANVKKLK